MSIEYEYEITTIQPLFNKNITYCHSISQAIKACFFNTYLPHCASKMIPEKGIHFTERNSTEKRKYD